MSNLTIFEEPSNLPTVRRESRRMDRMSSGGGSTMRRIQLSNGRTFKRVVNGEQIGKAAHDTLDVIIVDWLTKPSRKFYATAYDKEAKATLPDCWSNDGDRPEASAGNKQAANCTVCDMNVVGSGQNGKGRACRFQRRIAVLLAGDTTGEVYQFNVPAKSLFGKGVGNVHPFESYVKYLLGHHESPDSVITNISYDLNADSMELLFTPVRGLNDDEYDLVKQVQKDPSTKRLCELTVAAQDGVKKQVAAPTPAPAPQVSRSDEPEEEIEEPKKRVASKPETVAASESLASVISAWGSGE